jgi:hypothetical protein
VGPAQSRQQKPGCLQAGPLQRGLRLRIIKIHQAPSGRVPA